MWTYVRLVWYTKMGVESEKTWDDANDQDKKHLKETSVTVTKRWNDSNDKDKIRPDSIKMQLYANGEKKGEAVQLKAENKWSYTWKDLPQKENGKDIK